MVLCMTTEYEKLLIDMIKEKKIKLEELQGKNEEKKAKKLRKEISFLQVELSRYQQALALFRSKNIPKVGRWGKPETEEGH